MRSNELDLIIPRFRESAGPLFIAFEMSGGIVEFFNRHIYKRFFRFSRSL